jgi:RsiW-degrading membrane proteinase PrsW (M82 family)
MDNVNVILFISIAVPLAMLLLLLEKEARLIVSFMIVGCFVNLFAANVNGLLLLLAAVAGLDFRNVVTTITPITEEILKALPVVLFAFGGHSRRKTLLAISMAVGIGFAVMEDTLLMINNLEQVNALWALVRGISSGVVHGLCTTMVGFGISFVGKRKKLFYTGTFALLSAAITIHAIFNSLVQSSLQYACLILPFVIYIPLAVAVIRKNLQQKKRE